MLALMSIPRAHVLRDAAIVLLTFLLWAADAALRESGGVVATAVACLAGALTAACAFLVHEWGHFLGARLARSVVHLPATPWSVFLFRFDTDQNGREQFIAMSLGGFAASALSIAVLLLVLPLHALSGWVAFGLSGLGVVATFVLEVPTFVRVRRGDPFPRGAAYVSAVDQRVGSERRV
jgi:hypothetical protein